MSVTWTNELELQCIEIYQAEPILWDPNQKEHKNKLKTCKVRDAATATSTSISFEVANVTVKIPRTIASVESLLNSRQVRSAKSRRDPRTKCGTGFTNFKILSLYWKKMSFAVQRGEPTAAQRFLDALLQSAAAETSRPVTLPDIIYYCMKTNPTETCLINGLTGVTLSNLQMLQRAVPLARALIARQMSGRILLPIMRNTEQLVALYYAAMFAGVKIFLIDPLSTRTEVDYFLPLVEPNMIVCDADRLDDVKAAVKTYGKLAADAVLTTENLSQFVSGQDTDPAKFNPVEVDPEACGVMLPTSGSTGMPKVAELQYIALLAHLPTLWGACTRFPRPTERVLFLSTAQWMTFTTLLTCCPVFGITLIITYDKTISKVINIIETYKPTWLLLAPFAGLQLSDTARPEQLVSLEIITLGGAPAPNSTVQALEALAPNAKIRGSYGMTEAQGWIAFYTKDTPLGSLGKPFNIFQYKLVDENNEVVKQPGVSGELYIKGPTTIKKYLKNEKAHREMMTADGWLKTGDIFTEDEDHNLFFVERKSFWFKCVVTMYHISPEEFEGVIKAVDGVMEVVVVGTERGAAAGVVRRPDSNVTREDIHQAIENSPIDPHKRLRGGIAFVDSLPHTHSGKLHRANCKRLIASLIETGECK